jgi:hypothetical protein
MNRRAFPFDHACRTFVPVAGARAFPRFDPSLSSTSRSR